MIRVVLPYHLRNLARVGEEVELEVSGSPTLRAVLDALESEYPVLQGTIRDRTSRRRRPFVRFFACGEDLSHQAADELLPPAVAAGAEQDLSHAPADTPLPDPVVLGVEPFLIVGATAGG